MRWSERAAAEFAETAAYVAREFGGQAAIKMRNGINEAVASISLFPNIGKTSFTDEESCTEFREFPCRLSSVIYSIYKDEIYIVSIWSNRQHRAKLYSALKAIKLTDRQMEQQLTHIKKEKSNSNAGLAVF